MDNQTATELELFRAELLDVANEMRARYQRQEQEFARVRRRVRDLEVYVRELQRERGK